MTIEDVLARLNYAHWEYEKLHVEEQEALRAYAAALETYGWDATKPEHEAVKAARRAAWDAAERLDRAYKRLLGAAWDVAERLDRVYMRLLEAREAWERAYREARGGEQCESGSM